MFFFFFRLLLYQFLEDIRGFHNLGTFGTKTKEDPYRSNDSLSCSKALRIPTSLGTSLLGWAPFFQSPDHTLNKALTYTQYCTLEVCYNVSLLVLV